MELSRSAKEILIQAQMFMKETGGSTLCVEHLLYGVLLLADYLEPPFDKDIYREDGEQVRALVEEKFLSVATAREQIKSKAGSDSSRYVDAKATLGRATELAHGGAIGAQTLTQAVLENSTPVMTRLKKAKLVRFADKDLRYHPELKEQEEQRKQEEKRKREEQKKQEEQRKREEQEKEEQRKREEKEKEERRKREEQRKQEEQRKREEQRRQEERRKQEEQRKQEERRKQEEQRRLEEQKKELAEKLAKALKKKRRTKMGLFTYKGGKTAAIVKYFLYGILIPAIPPLVLQLTTGFLNQPHAPWLSFLGMLYVCLWGFYLGRGLSLTLGLASSALGNFLDVMLDFGLIAAVVRAVSLAWGLSATPRWLRIVSCIVALLVQVVGNALYGNLRDDGDTTKTRILLSNEEGTPGKIFFHTVSKTLFLPLIGFSIWWIFDISLPAWAVKALWITAFVLVYYVIWVGSVCHGLRFEKSRRHRKGARFAKFLVHFTLEMFIPCLVLVLHWVFGWFPMKIWVMIVLGLYTLFFFITSVGVARMDQ